ncbi:CHY zinc finger [Streptococcus sp. M143]|uniref:CHY zinc finger protein n=1 Tax=Streptococcus sp. M143 TaxID=563037 RepID=UPI0001BEE199|nr:CHY zinc finger protein [Streptococcus sp. M143]EFA24667.1 CHY zinc finger [Streptococcus sp. M143]
MIQAHGLLVDDESRCVHYHSVKDIVSLQCYECKKYYACYQCHNSMETHVFSPYPLALTEDQPILCGACKRTMTFQEYQKQIACPYCSAPFNPGCKQHHSFYFK